MNHQKSANPSNAALYARTSTVSAYKLHTNCIWLSSCEATQTDAAYGAASVTCETVATSRSLIPRAGVASGLKNDTRLRCRYGLTVKTHAFSTSAKREGGMASPGPLSPNLVPHTTSAPFFFYGPMKAFGPCASSAPPWWEPASSWEKSWKQSSASETFRRARYRLQDQ